MNSAASERYFDEVHSFIGTTLGDPSSDDAESAPKSARHVITVSWSFSPGHSRTGRYLLSSDRARAGFHLYETFYDDNSCRMLSSRVGSCYPYRRGLSVDAALALLDKVWQSEKDQWGFDAESLKVLESGLLDATDIKSILEGL